MCDERAESMGITELQRLVFRHRDVCCDCFSVPAP
jgi:hypothetical protein